MHKTRLTQNNKAKHTSNAKQKQEEERKKSDKITWMKTELRNLLFINLDRYLSVEQLSSLRLKQLSLNLDRC